MNETDYRTSAAPEADKTEIAKERLRQEGETKRKLIEERETTKRHESSEAGFYATNFRHLFGAIVGVTAIVAGAIVASYALEVKRSQVEHTSDGMCRDEYLAFGSTGVKMSCAHPLQIAEVRGDNRLFCKCAAQPAPSASAAP